MSIESGSSFNQEEINQLAEQREKEVLNTLHMERYKENEYRTMHIPRLERISNECKGLQESFKSALEEGYEGKFNWRDDNIPGMMRDVMGESVIFNEKIVSLIAEMKKQIPGMQEADEIALEERENMTWKDVPREESPTEQS